jgi:hypothetical protein
MPVKSFLGNAIRGHRAVCLAGPARTRARERRGLGLAQPGAGGRAGSDGGMDNWIAANGSEGGRALADMPVGGALGRLSIRDSVVH